MSALGVGRGDDAALGDRGMLEQHRLDLRPGDVVARRDDHVVGARLVPEEAVCIHEVGVAGDVPAVLDVFALALVGEIAAAGRTAHREPADRAGPNLAPALVDHLGFVAGHDPAGGAGTDVLLGRADEDVQHFGRADPVHDLEAGCLKPCVEGRLRQSLAGRDAFAQRGNIVLADLRQHGAVGRGRGEHDGRPPQRDGGR